MTRNHPIIQAWRSAGVHQLVNGGMWVVESVAKVLGVKAGGSAASDLAGACRGVLVLAVFSGMTLVPQHARETCPPDACAQVQKAEPCRTAARSCAPEMACCDPASRQSAMQVARDTARGPDAGLPAVSTRRLATASLLESGAPRFPRPAPHRLFIWVRALLL